MNSKSITRESLGKALDSYLESLKLRKKPLPSPIDIGGCSVSSDGRVTVDLSLGWVVEKPEGEP